MARVRVHQHVNPLAKYYREIPIEPLDLSKEFETSDQPIHIDVGCGRGRFLLRYAEQNPGTNFVGLEIREPLVDEANQLAKERGLRNLTYIFCNAPLDLGRVLEEVPVELIEMYTIQFPDPWFKKKHAKRRMVNSSLIDLIKTHSSKETRVFVQTDIEELFNEINEVFLEAGFAVEEKEESVLEQKTEREVSVENRDLPVHRALILQK